MRRVGEDEALLALGGYLCPYRDATQPLVLQLEGEAGFFVPIFSTEAMLRAAARRIGFEYFKIVQITDGHDFLASIAEGGMRVIIDVRVLDDGKVRFMVPADAATRGAS